MFAALRGMVNLETLRIVSCPVTGADLALLKGHPNLETIFLPDAGVTREDLRVLLTLPGIRHYQIGGQ